MTAFSIKIWTNVLSKTHTTLKNLFVNEPVLPEGTRILHRVLSNYELKIRMILLKINLELFKTTHQLKLNKKELGSRAHCLRLID